MASKNPAQQRMRDCVQVAIFVEHKALRDLSNVITATHLSLPGEMQPLWGPNELRVLP